jgi:hypothetical protein
VQGAAEYVSPEQIEGRPVDQRSNIYSLGAIFHLLLTGRPPYSGSAEEVHQQHLRGDFSSRAGNQALDPAIAPVIARAMERTSSRRFMTLRQFLDEVRRAAASAGTSADVGTTTQPMGRPGAMQKGKRDKRLVQTMMGGYAIDDDAGSTQKMGSAAAEPAPPTEKMPSPEYARPAPDPVPPAAAAAGNLAPPMEPLPAEPAPAPVQPEPPAPVQPEPPAPIQPEPQPAAAPVSPPESTAPRREAEAGGPATPVGQPWHEQVPDHVTGEVARIAERAGLDVSDGPTTPEPGVPDSPMLAKRSERRAPKEPEKEVLSAGKGGKGRFRETLWFKKGALDAEVAEQAAKADPARAGALVADKADEMPIEDRYEDDGSIDARDKQAFSLRTGHSQSMRAMADAPRATEDGGVSEDDLISEMKSGRGKIILVLVVGLVLAAVLVAYFVLSGGDGDSKENESPPAAEKTPG